MEIENTTNNASQVYIMDEPEGPIQHIEERRDLTEVKERSDESNDSIYSFQSHKFWCFKCQKEFSKLRLD